MLKCRDIASQASSIVEGNQTLGQRLAVAFHLLICGRCRAFIRHLKTSLVYFRELPHKPLADEEADAITKRVTGNEP